jgi:hypothetical protein
MKSRVLFLAVDIIVIGFDPAGTYSEECPTCSQSQAMSAKPQNSLG